jgi:hypothetical protein
MSTYRRGGRSTSKANRPAASRLDELATRWRLEAVRACVALGHWGSGWRAVFAMKDRYAEARPASWAAGSRK